MGLMSSSEFGYVMSILLLICSFKSQAQRQVFNINQFGAVTGGSIDSSKALSKAWSEACAFHGGGEVLVPRGTFLVLPLLLQGPCNGWVQLQIEGVLVAPSDRSHVTGDFWLAIHNVHNLVVDGGGTLDGQGASAWPFNHCSGACSGLPVTLRFNEINTGTIRNIKSINSKFFHFTVYKSQTVTFDHITLLAPADSPNTDGIHISNSNGINVVDSIISTGDDCISLGPGSRTINITGVQCGPGHGISIGSLGKNPSEDDVVGVTVKDCIFSGTANGVRIKSWSSPYKSLVSNVEFVHLQMNNVQNPIIIDQSYCPHNSCHQKQTSKSQVQIRDVRYEDIWGSSNTKVAVDFDCSQVAPCQGIVLHDINLSFNGGGPTTASCYNVKGSASGKQLPPSCL